MASSAPVPKPRLNVGELKKPVPKPRQKVNVISSGADILVDASNNFHETSEKEDSESGAKNVKESKDDTKEVSSSGTLKSRHLKEGTKVVGQKLEKVLSLTRRGKNRNVLPEKDYELSRSKIMQRSVSLPTEDVLLNISFVSPITGKSAGSDDLEEEPESNEEGSETYDTPPPVYPPPPLPDESVYDAVQLNHGRTSISSLSVQCSSLPRDTVYEHIALDSIGKPIPSKPRIISTMSSSVASHSNVDLSRSDSWTYFDSVADDKSEIDGESSVGLCAARDTLSIVSIRTQSACSVSPSLSELDTLACISGDEYYEDDRSSSSPSRSSASHSVSVQNELYDNWEPLKSEISSGLLRSKETDRKLPSKSVILEFDPLFSIESTVNSENSNHDDILFNTEMKDIPVISNESGYGNIIKPRKETRESKVVHSYDEVTLDCPPVPPRRYDSITNASSAEWGSIPELPEDRATGSGVQPMPVPRVFVRDDSVVYEPSRPGSRPARPCTEVPSSKIPSDGESGSEKTSKQPSSKLTRLASMRKAVRAVADTTSNWSPHVIRRNGKFSLSLKDHGKAHQDKPESSTSQRAAKKPVVERPEIPQQIHYPYSGIVYKVTAGRDRQQDAVQRWCVLAEDKLTFYSDKTATAMKEVVALNSILSLHVVTDQKLSVDGDCFELNTSSKGRLFIFGTSGPSERRMWMQKILESLTTIFPLRIISDFTRGGWCYLKEGISGKWYTSWIVLHKRVFYYSLEDSSIQEVDLRKARCVALQDPHEEKFVLQVTEKGPLILVDCQGTALYLCMDTVRETRAWEKIIRNSAVDNGPNLDQQQLTKDDIPVIVDKCIKFVFAHGCMSEGIYRRSGANTSVTKLLGLFRSGAWSVHLSRQDYTEYDVSSVLKRFFRDIPEPLLTTELHGQFCNIAAGKNQDDKIMLYRRVLEKLPPVNFLTTRKLLGHLHTIHEQREKNRMPVENLAAIWGPTLMHIENSEALEWSRLETAVVADLIMHHVELFEIDAEEQSREKRMQEVLERINASNCSKPQSKQSGELHVWVYLNTKDSGNCVNITIGPQKLAGEVCSDLAVKMNAPAHELVLQEAILNGSLTRYLHHTEKVLDTVLRWGYWDDSDCKDNCLILQKNDNFKEVVPFTKPPLAMSGELRYADMKNKSFKPFVFEFSQAKLCYYKDKKGSVKLSEWKIEDIVWYTGYEPKRNPQTRWSITFIEKNKRSKRSKEFPFFGHTIAGTSKDEQLRWMAALLIGEYPQGILMPPTLIQY